MHLVKHLLAIVALFTALAFIGCNGAAKTDPAAPTKPAAPAKSAAPAAPAKVEVKPPTAFFTQYDKNGRLWVLGEPSKELEEFKKSGEPAKSVTRLGALPGLTIKSSDHIVLDAYVAGVKSGAIQLPAKPAGG